MVNLPLEEWRPVVGWEDFYEVSSLGKVRSVTRETLTKCGNVRTFQGRILKPGLSSTDYPAVILSVGGKHTCRKIHRLVGQAFVPNPNNYAELNHIDGNRANAAASNLEWCTRQENINHAWEIGLSKVHYNRRKGEQVAVGKLTSTQVISIRRENQEGASISLLAQKYGVNRSTIFSICKRKTWKHI